MRTKLIALTLALASSPAFALRCDTDADCVSATLSLIKKAVKLKACAAEASAAARGIELVASPDDGSIAALEKCVETAKYEQKVMKRRDKRVARINKALGQK